MKQIDFSGMSALGRAARDRLYRGRLIFVHIPKSGGTSLSHALRLRYPLSHFRLSEEQSLSAADGLDLAGWMDLKRRILAYHAESGTHFLQGHIAVDAEFIARYTPQYRFLTILRDPVDRVLSHYFFDPALRRMPPEEFLASERGFIETHVLCHFFGELGWTARGGLDAAVARAIANMEQFAAVGVLENLEAFYRDLHAQSGLRLSIPRRNVGQHRDEHNLPLGFAEAVRDLCRHDALIYEHFTRSAQRGDAH